MELVIRPAAVVGIVEANTVLRSLERLDVGRGGVWSATPGVWQRFDKPWDGENGGRGTARLVGSVAVVYDAPRRNEITIFRVNVTAHGAAAGWTVEALCDDALLLGGLTLATCPRAELLGSARPDPFRVPAQRGPAQVPSHR